jgi:hypothetical protein
MDPDGLPEADHWQEPAFDHSTNVANAELASLCGLRHRQQAIIGGGTPLSRVIDWSVGHHACVAPLAE